MFEQDFRVTTLRGLGGVQIKVGASLALLLALYLSLSVGLNPDAGKAFAILILSALLAGHVQVAVARLQGLDIRGLALGGAGVDLVRSTDAPARDELLLASVVPIVHLGLFAFFGLAANLTADIAGATQTAEAHAFWRGATEHIWQVALLNFFLGMLHLMPAYPLAGGLMCHAALQATLPPQHANMIAGFLGLMMFMFWIPLSLAYLSVGLVVFLTAPSWHDNMALYNNQTRV